MATSRKSDRNAGYDRKSDKRRVIPQPAARQPGTSLSCPEVTTFAHFYVTFRGKLENLWTTQARFLDAGTPESPEVSFTPLSWPAFLGGSEVSLTPPSGPPSRLLLLDAAVGPGLLTNSETGDKSGPDSARESQEYDGI